jgi:tocopherol cyclase
MPVFQNLARRHRALWQPDMYHGWGRTRRYFEGWYFKCVSADERHALAFIPGISMAADGTQHAFVQVMYGSENRAAYHRFEAHDFRPDDRRFAVNLGQNHFSGTEMRLDLPDVTGHLFFKKPIAWPKMLGAPGIMGWFSFVPFMECSHGVVSMDHVLEGDLYLAGQRVAMSGGRGYLEKDWGRSFPSGYVWMQSNHFGTDAPVSMLASVAHIPFLGSHFIGFISGFWLEKRLFRFATYTGARKSLHVGDDTVTLIFKNPNTELRILAHRAEGVALVSPLSGNMTGKINESLQARLEVELYEGGRRIFEGVGRHAGLEVVNSGVL